MGAGSPRRTASGEGPDAGDVAADDQRLHRLGPLVRVDRLDVGHVPNHVVLQQDSVAAEHVTRLGADLTGLARVVELREPGDRVAELAALGQPTDLHAVELHRGDLGEHLHEPVLDDLEAAQRPAELLAALGVRERRVVGGDGVSERRPGAGAARPGEDTGGVLEAVRAGQAVRRRHLDVLERDLSLPDRAQRALALDHLGLVSGSSLLDQEPVDLAVLAAGPDHDDVGDAAGPDPPLGTVQHVGVADAPRARLEPDGIGAVIRLGERERAQLLETGHPRQPAVLLLLGAEHRDRLHRQPGLDPEERPKAAVAAVELHVDEAAGDRVEARAAVAVDVLADDGEFPEPLDQGPRHVGALPVAADHRQHLVVDEHAHAAEQLELLVGELLAQEEVVGGERMAKVSEQVGGGQHRDPPVSCGVSSGSASAIAIAR